MCNIGSSQSIYIHIFSEVVLFFVPQFGRTALISACYSNSFSVVEVLLAAKADTEVEDKVGGLS